MGATPELGTASKRQSQDFPIPLSHSHILDWSTVTSAQPARDGQAGVCGPGHRSDPDFRQRKSPQGILLGCGGAGLLLAPAVRGFSSGD